MGIYMNPHLLLLFYFFPLNSRKISAISIIYVHLKDNKQAKGKSQVHVVCSEISTGRAYLT